MTRQFMAAVSVLLISGCACFSGNNLPHVTTLPSLQEGAKRPTFSYSFSYGTDLWARGDDEYHKSQVCRDEFVHTLYDSEYFSLPVTENADVTIKTHMFVSGSHAFNVAKTVTGLTIFAIPSWGSKIITVTANIKKRNDKEYDYKLEDSVTEAYWLPLVVTCVSCADRNWGAPGAVRRNIWKNLLLRMYQDGIFN